MKKLKVDADTCLGCGLCVGTYPDAFAFDADNKAEVTGELSDEDAENVIAQCPVSAIAED